MTIRVHVSKFVVVNCAVQVLKGMLQTVGKISLLVLEDVVDETYVFFNNVLGLVGVQAMRHRQYDHGAF